LKGTTSVQDLYNKNKSIYNNDRHKYKDESNKDESNKANTLKQNAA